MHRAFRFRAPGDARAAEQLLAWAFPAFDPERRSSWLKQRLLCAGPGREIAPGERVGDAASLRLEVDPESVSQETWPSLRLVGQGAFVLVASPPWRRGRLPLPHDAIDGSPSPFAAGAEIAWEAGAAMGDATELRLRLETGDTDAASGAPPSPALAFDRARRVLDALADAGLPVLGDVWNGGRVVGPGPAWRAADAGSHAEAEAWPEAPLYTPRDAERGGRWIVSEATARVLARGHPWIRPDDESEDASRFRPGERVEVATADGRQLGQALVDGAGAVAGRRVSRPGETGWSVEASVARALKRRSDFADALGRTDAFRLVHGEADGLPGLFIDRLGPLVRVLVTARSALTLVDRALQALGPAMPQPWRILEVLHLDERAVGRFERVRVHPWSMDPDGAAALGRRSRVSEAGLVYTVAPGLEEPEKSAPGFGLFLDQRENRARLAKRARRGGRYLNLFAHTGAFSVALLAAGAERVESVDLSAAYLRWLEENLAQNASRGVDEARHVSIRQDGRRVLERLEPDVLYDGIVLDPPTAAAAGRQFFSVRRDLLPMVGACLSRLAPGGVLLLTLNDRKARRRLEAVVEEAALDQGVALAKVRPAPPSHDFPHLDGFDEGDAFRGCWVERSDDC